jgi:hypothetical protein
MQKAARRPALVSSFAIFALTASASAQAPAAGQATNPNANIVVEKPTYAVLPLEVTVNRPAAEVWKRVGKWCDVSEWLQIAAGCQILSGNGHIGSTRSVGSEVMVGETELSYTYTQPVRAGRPYDLYHGTLEVRPLTATTSKIMYTLLFDNSMLPDDAARERNKQQRTAAFTRALNNMKILAEGGTLPPPPPPAAPAAPATPR